jgi:protein O-GlcNAc transferase
MTPPPPGPSGRPALQPRLGLALDHHRRGETERAAVLYRDILKDHPRSFDALHLLGVIDVERGAMEEGIALIRRALAVDASHAPAHYGLAAALLKSGEDEQALASLDRALALQPEFADAWFLRANLLQKSQRLDEAVESYARAIRARPAFVEALNNLAAALCALRRLPDALDYANRALALQPSYPRGLNNRGLIQLALGNRTAAVEDFSRALLLDGRFPEAWHNLGTTLMQLRRFAQAREAFARLAALAPDFRHAAGNLLLAKLSCCDWSGFGPAVDSVIRAVDEGRNTAVPMSFLCICDSARLQLRCAQMHTLAYYPARAAPAARPRNTHDRIRVAYLSGDLGEHAVTYLFAGVLERHDTQRFESIALSWDRRGDGAARRRVETAFERFIDISGRDDEGTARLMRELQIDIAVDLAGHTLGQRTGILARRAAPIQVNYLGLPATMGAPYIDYLIADRFLVPEERRDCYAEQIVWMPECFQPNDDRRPSVPEPPPRRDLGLPEQAFVFCSFNRNNKLNPPCFEVWMRVLRSVPQSVLWLLATDAAAEENLRREATARGVEPGRLVFAREAPYLEYLARYRCADLFLDTLPFNGGATVSDAVSMGVPVLTCAGDSFASRMAGSVLTSLGLPELVTYSLEEYAAAATALAQDPQRLGQLRRKLERSESQAFFDTDRYRRHLEAAYRTMWERHMAGQPPAAFAVP